MNTTDLHRPCTNLTQAGIISLHQAIADALYRSGATAAQARRRADRLLVAQGMPSPLSLTGGDPGRSYRLTLAVARALTKEAVAAYQGGAMGCMTPAHAPAAWAYEFRTLALVVDFITDDYKSALLPSCLREVGWESRSMGGVEQWRVPLRLLQAEG